MNGSTRREVVLGGLLTIFYGCGCCSQRAHAQASNTGCWVPRSDVPSFFQKATHAEAFETGSETMEPRSGNPTLDRALAQALATISRTFEILPGFSYYDDSGSPNARATTEVLLNRTDGTVLFGLNFLKMLLSRPTRPDASIVAVCSHEFGHIVSYKHNLIRSLNPTQDNPFRGEQFADYMAGYYAGRRKLEHADFPAVAFATTQRDFGGGDHGTGDQRGNAVQQGFLDAYKAKLTIADAIQAGFTYSMAQTLRY
jgi:hypothetical protein